MIIFRKIAEAIRKNDKKEYQDTRYPHVQDGDDVIFMGEDFTNVDFGQFVPGFFRFEKCKLDGARNIVGQPIYIENSTAVGIDLSNCTLTIEAVDVDFTGMKYDSDTILGRPENGEAGCSRFTNCKFDEETKSHFIQQGVKFISSGNGPTGAGLGFNLLNNRN